eukprot:TRINITY_DN10513_c0_g1_i1.p1 TRINITY_DN10513_c0_g1~~TRINITY_DN10513_c0_g1_i1.p1  ORF type:complete len:135 (-),score=21.79 TRINITY_DN10513_c0_g1_i1:42-416(-)
MGQSLATSVLDSAVSQGKSGIGEVAGGGKDNAGDDDLLTQGIDEVSSALDAAGEALADWQRQGKLNKAKERSDAIKKKYNRGGTSSGDSSNSGSEINEVRAKTRAHSDAIREKYGMNRDSRHHK